MNASGHIPDESAEIPDPRDLRPDAGHAGWDDGRAGRPPTRWGRWARQITPRRVLAAIGLAVYGIGWLLPHTSLDEAVVVSVPLVTAESAPAATLPRGMTRSQATEAAAVRALDPRAVVEFESSGTPAPTMRISLPGCRPDDGCGPRLADGFRTQRVAALDVAVGARSTELPALINDAAERLDRATLAAGELASMSPAEFTAFVAAGSAQQAGGTWQESFDRIAGYQWLVQEQQALASLEAEQVELRESAARIVGEPTITSTMLPARGAAQALIVSGAGALLALVALAGARKRFPARPTGLRSGVPALLARSALVLVGAAVWSIGVEGLALYREGRGAIKKMELIRTSIAAGDFDTADGEVKHLEALMTHAREMIDQAPSQVLRILPGGSYHRRQSLAMIDVFGANLTTVRVLGDEIDRAQHSALPYAERAASIQATLAAAAGRLRTIDDPVDILSGADEVRIAHDEFVVEARRALGDGAGAARVVERAITERQRFVLLVGSTTDTRAVTGGVALVGTLRLENNGLVLDELRSVAGDVGGDAGEVDVEADVLPPMSGDGGITLDDADAARTLAAFAAGSDWTTLTLTPRFDAAARATAQMWEARSNDHIDGVVYVDAVALRHLLSVLGPVTVGERTIGPDDVLAFAESGQFESPTGGAASARQDGLRELVAAVVARLGATAPSTEWFAPVAAAVDGRHLMVWTSDAAQGSGPGGATGRLRPESLAVSVAPMNGRYDPFVTVSVAMDARCSNGSAAVTLTVTRSFDGAPTAAQVGVSDWFLPQLDTSLGLLTASLPAASSIDLGSAAPAVMSGPDGPTRRYATWMETAQGTTSRATLKFELPGGSRILVEASGRGTKQTWALGDESWDSTEGPHAVDLPRC